MHRSTEIMNATKHKVLVLGAGINGLSSAVRIQEAFDDVTVTIMAEKFSPHTTSDGSGGFWEPFAIGDNDPAVINELGKETFDYLLNLSLSPDAGLTKIHQISGFQYYDVNLQKELDFKDIVDGYRRLTAKEIARFPGTKDGIFFTSMSAQVTDLLRWLTERFLAKGGQLMQRKIHSLEEVSCGWDVVVNCVGLGAYHLIHDHRMKPIRGQVFRVEAPWIQHFLVFEELSKKQTTYVFPNVDSVVVGGTFTADDWDENVNDVDAREIWARAVRLVPSLKDAKILKRWAGLRPGRDKIRLEREQMEIGPERRKLHVVHNYGHGGAGITLFWSCARHTTQMVGQSLQELKDQPRSVMPRSKM